MGLWPGVWYSPCSPPARGMNQQAQVRGDTGSLGLWSDLQTGVSDTPEASGVHPNAQCTDGKTEAQPQKLHISSWYSLRGTQCSMESCLHGDAPGPWRTVWRLFHGGLRGPKLGEQGDPGKVSGQPWARSQEDQPVTFPDQNSGDMCECGWGQRKLNGGKLKKKQTRTF